jgi:hypothetical protein
MHLQADLLSGTSLGDTTEVQRCLNAGVDVNCRDLRVGASKVPVLAWKGDVDANLVGCCLGPDGGGSWFVADTSVPHHTELLGAVI